MSSYRVHREKVPPVDLAQGGLEPHYYSLAAVNCRILYYTYNLLLVCVIHFLLVDRRSVFICSSMVCIAAGSIESSLVFPQHEL